MSGPEMVSEREAGRALDAEVATRVMGLDPVEWDNGTPCPYCGDEMRYCGERSRCTQCNEWRYSQYREYSSEIQEAWAIVGKLSAMDCGVHIGCYVTSWDCEIVNPGGLSCVISDQPTAPLAICLAALKAPEAFERPDFYAVPVSGEPPK